MVLMELAETYDIEAALRTFNMTINAGSGVGTPNYGSGPYLLPTDYLRMWRDDIIYQVNGTPYHMISIELDDFDNQVQQPGISNFPLKYATDVSNDAIAKYGSKVMYVWPPAGMVLYPKIRYWSLPPDIPSPQGSTVIPWFPNTNYLITRVAGELMKLTDDARADTFLGDGPSGAQGILDRYLKKQTDIEGRARVVTLDRRRFGTSFASAKNTKTLGWVMAWLTIGIFSFLSYHPSYERTEKCIYAGVETTQQGEVAPLCSQLQSQEPGPV
jgi:hypothetical protein